jgi:hypothetical protein
VLSLLETPEGAMLDLRRAPPLLLGAAGQADLSPLRARANRTLLTL